MTTGSLPTPLWVTQIAGRVPTSSEPEPFDTRLATSHRYGEAGVSCSYNYLQVPYCFIAFSFTCTHRPHLAGFERVCVPKTSQSVCATP